MNMLLLLWGLASAVPQQQGYHQGLAFELEEKRIEGEHVASQFNELLTSTQGSLLAHPLIALLVTVLLVLVLYLLSVRICRLFGSRKDVQVILQRKEGQGKERSAQVRRYTSCKELL